MIIYGSGMAGLLAANMLRRYSPKIREKQKSLPNNHDALLRFRNNSVGVATNIPFKKVKVRKAIKYDKVLNTEPTLYLSNLYSQKVTGSYFDRSINNLEPVERYIAPPNLISLMAEGINIEYNKTLEEVKENSGEPIISTIPMPILMKLTGWDNVPEFKFKTIWSQRTEITDPEINVNQTIYYPDPLIDYYRISVTGKVVIAEFIRPPKNSGPDIMGALMDDFGIHPKRLSPIKQSEMQYGKLLPIDEYVRREFIHWTTQKYGIYSLGRFATWRQLLLDDVVKDINVIDGFLNNSYKRALHEKGKEDV
tara:strand:+ start:2362 stop:3285 length:924 start_codon:yes stop_codon:yes gene_type:complete